jgi:ribosomal protein L11 methyltransferase
MRVVQVVAPAEEVELAADRLWAAGAGAVEEIDLGDGRVGLRSVLAADDAVSLARLGELPAGWSVEVLDLDDAPAETWRDFAAPVEIGDRVVLRPAWLPPLDDGRIEIAIEPAGSFGLGDHPTTRLTAAAVVRLVRPGCRVLDVGSGSGVLGILALRLGAECVVAIDIAEAAVEATAANAARNGVADHLEVSSTPIEQLEGSFDLVLANVLAPTIVAMSDALVRLTAPSGTLVVSGILADAHGHVVDALAPLRPTRTDESDAWAAVEFS